MDSSQSFIWKLSCSISDGLPHALPVHAFEKSERELVAILHSHKTFTCFMDVCNLGILNLIVLIAPNLFMFYQVQGVLQMLQGFSSPMFFWDQYEQGFCLKSEIYASHLSQKSLSGIVNQFAFGGSCLKKVECFVKKAVASHQGAPTLKAFTNSVKSWLKVCLLSIQTAVIFLGKKKFGFAV